MFVELYRDNLIANFLYLGPLFKATHIAWAVVSQLVCGSDLYLREFLPLDIIEICDARVRNLVNLHKLAPEVDTVYVMPPATGRCWNLVQYADALFNTEFRRP